MYTVFTAYAHVNWCESS